MLRKLFTLIVCLVSAVATASSQTPPDNEIWYTTTDRRTISFNDDDLVSNSYNNGRGVLKFRDSVTSIEYIIFRGRSSLTSITIPNSVTSIGEYAFNGCRSLISITIPNSVTSIGEYAFAWCNSLKSITIPNSVTRIEYGAFNGCSSLKSFKGKYASSDGRCLIIDGELIAFAPAGLTSYTIPNSVTSIEFSAFVDCSSLASITIPNSVTSIGEYAFEGCSSLKSITIPNNVTEIELYAFYGCSSLTSITIPNSVTYIGECVFYRCDSVTSITIPNSVTEIGFCAFAGCSSLKSITIPASVTSIDSDAFEDCSSLKSVKVANEYCYDYFKELGVSDITFAVSTLEEYEEAQQLGATKIAIDSNSEYASKDGLCLIDNGKLILFIGKDLTEYTIPNSVTSIGEYAFYDCTSLTSITIPNSVTSIGKGAFAGCSSLKSITIPDSVTSIGEEAFENCSSLKSVKVANKDCYDYFKDNVANIAFYGANASDDGRCLIVNGELQRFIGNGITEYTIPESVTSIGNDAFHGCSSLTSITIPDSVTSIEGSAFEGCSSLKSFKGKYASSDGRYLIIDGELKIFIAKGITEYTIPDSVTSIGFCAFAGCSSLTSITIPNSVTSIGEVAFDGCSSLTSITIPNSVISIGEVAFDGCSSLKSVEVSNEYCYDYFKNKVANIAFYGANASDDGRCLILDGKLERFSAKGITEYTIPESVTSIGDHTFNGCSNLTSITIPDSVTNIGKWAFDICSSLKSVKVSNKYCYDYFKDKVDDIAFYGANASDDGRCLILDGKLERFSAKGITGYTIPESITSIGEEAFKNCSSLKSVKVANEYCYDYFKNKVANIAFYGANASDDGRCLILDGKLERFSAKGITEYTIPESVTSIGDHTFNGCSNLTSITIPNSVTSIGDRAFSSCSSLKSVKVSNKYCYDYFKDKVDDIAFYGANASDDGRCLILDGKLERFSAKGITEYTIPESVTSIEDYTFKGCSSLTSITIPESVTEIGCLAFDNCSSLTSITCLATTPPAIDYLGIAETTMIYVPKEAVKAYKKDLKWSIYKKQIKPIK